jgi:hypothetical protein
LPLTAARLSAPIIECENVPDVRQLAMVALRAE